MRISPSSLLAVAWREPDVRAGCRGDYGCRSVQVIGQSYSTRRRHRACGMAGLAHFTSGGAAESSCGLRFDSILQTPSLPPPKTALQPFPVTQPKTNLLAMTALQPFPVTQPKTNLLAISPTVSGNAAENQSPSNNDSSHLHPIPLVEPKGLSVADPRVLIDDMSLLSH